MVDIEYIDDAEQFGNEIQRLLYVADEEFVPPLSNREGTTQIDGLQEQRNDALDEYYEQCIDQSFIIVHKEDDVHGFLSFRQGYDIKALGSFSPSTYVSTIIVDPSQRRNGYARSMYQELLTNVPTEVLDPYVTTRTWHTNDHHLNLLDDLGFELLECIDNDRGKGIDTVYYGIEVSKFNE